MSPDDKRHGTYAGARRHRVLDIPICDPCKMAAARYQNMREYDLLQGRPRAVSPVGARRRIQGLVHLGYSYRELAPHLGVSPGQVHKWATHDQAFIRATSLERIAVATATLGMTPAPTSRNAAYARTVAKRNGWLPLLAWDSIDDENENPTGWEYLPPTRAEQLAEWVEQGRSISHVCAALAISKVGLERWCERKNLRHLYVTLTAREYVKPGSSNQYTAEAS